ncbi:hypothetical protein CANARDRAFT_200950 [[Candida] arabinofermentans NRRL YB-2248]|uniref:Uncharacterized protein n=1 Tax=[Candida] arabinofermentans NRRL YB-2248 TaxID=983967 RepID=A0A1E4SYM8_9ASCO|nr:hypothetical protein CANARDRAFT_200950 [[Candida] arabinofermentans NRRL YB-2248]
MKAKDLSEQQQQQQQQQQQPTTTSSQNVTVRPRRVLGVISDTTLNTRLPKTNDSDSTNGKLPSISDLQQEEKSQSQSQSQPQSQNHSPYIDHHDGIEEDYDEGNTTTHFESEPMSPIMNDSIVDEITNAFKKYSNNYLDPNDEDTFDVTMVAEYGNQIFNYLHELEYKFSPSPKYIEKVQNELTYDHRSTLLNWLIQLHSRFNLLPETLFLTINIIDRFLSIKAISLSRFQLCGAVALFIASKYEEINVPTVSQMIYMIGDQFTITEFLRAEKFMIEVLNFEFGYPGPMSFLRRGSKADDYDNEIRTLAKYFLEVSIMEPKLISSPPSWIAAGSQFLARKMLGRGDWSQLHIYYTGYTKNQLLPLVEVLEDCCLNSDIHHPAVFKKYSTNRFSSSSIYVRDYLQVLYEEQQ